MLEVVREDFQGGVMAAATEKCQREGCISNLETATGHCRARSSDSVQECPGFSFRCDFNLNLTVGSTSKIKVLE